MTPERALTLADALSRAHGHEGAVRRTADRYARASAWADLAVLCTPDDTAECVRRMKRAIFWQEVLYILATQAHTNAWH